MAIGVRPVRPEENDEAGEAGAKKKRGSGPPGESGEPLLTEEAHVRMVGVRAEDRRRGVGRRLMEGCIDEARRAGKSLVTLHTTERMTAAQRMYESMGFERGQDYVFPDGFRLLGYERRI